MTIGKRILELRTRAGWSREALAGKVDLTARSIENYENDFREPKGSDLIRIAKALGTTVAYLVGEINSPDWNALKPIEEVKNYRLLHGEGELANAELMKLMEEELDAIRRLRIEKENEIRSNTRSREERAKGTGEK